MRDRERVVTQAKRHPVLLAALIGVLSLPAAASAATVTVTPAIPWRGASVRLDVSGFQPRARGVASLSGVRSVNFRVDQRGRVRVVVPVPRTARRGRHALRVQAGGRSVSTALTLVGARRASSTMAVLPGGRRVLLDPASGRIGAKFTVKATGFSSRSPVDVRFAGASLARKRPNASGDLTIAGSVPASKPGARVVRVASGPTVVSLRFQVLSPLVEPPTPEPAAPAQLHPPPADATAPTVFIQAPAAGATVSGNSVSVIATASDNAGVSGVQFRLDGKELNGEDTTAPYSTSWNTTAASDGSHALTAVARDAAGNATTSNPVSVTVDNASPTVSIKAPPNGTTVSGSSVSVAAEATDVGGVSAVQFRLDGKDLGAEDTNAPYSTTWNTSAVSDGSHALTAVARDGAAHTTTSAAVSVTVNNTAVRRIVVAGDIACSPTDPFFNGGDGTPGGHCRQKATSDLFVGKGYSDVLTLGDTQYDCATAADFAGSFHPTWGRAKSIIRPATGNHEYNCDEAAGGYFGYFGGAAGPPDRGYYSFDIGSWHVVSLNTNDASSTGCPVVSCALGSAQERWLQADLAAHQTACTLAIWHHPLFSSKTPGVSTASRPFWDDLYAAGADVVLNGHVHNYERFRPQRPDGALDLARGIAQFVVGTGGVSLESTSSVEFPPAVNRAAATRTFGVLDLTLRPTGYDWQFLTAAGQTVFNDTGSAACH
jgi:hypothetical protein